MPLEVVEVFEAFQVHDYAVRVGARVMAWKRKDDRWIVYFNGAELAVPDGTVAPVGTVPEKKEAAAVYSDARLEQYAVAPAPPKA